MSEAREPTGRALLEATVEGSLAEPSARPLFAWLAARTAAGAFAIALVFLAESKLDAGRFAFSSKATLFIGAFLVAGSAGLAWLAKRGAPRRTLGTPLVLMDLVVIAGLVYLTGGAASVFASLFGVVILLAALLLGPEAALITTATALVLHIFVALGLAAGILLPPPDAPRAVYEISPVALSLALTGHASALLVVGLLSRALAVRVRRAGGDVRRAQASAKRLERLNTSIIANIGSGLATVDTDGSIASLNPAAQRILGAASGSLVGADARALLPLADTPLPPARSERLDGTGRRADGSEFPCGLTASRLRGEDEDLTLIVFQDLTELKRLKDQAEQAERLASLGRIAASLAHEIRNPLGAISGSVQLVRGSSSLDEDERRLLAIVSREVERLDDLVATMLAASRPGEPARRFIDLRGVAADVVDLVGRGPLASSKDRIRIHGEGEVRAFADDRQIRQVLWNLIKNALVATPEGGGIEIRVTRMDAGARIDVDDCGPGIPIEARARLFEPFYSGQPLGVGLGLSIVDQIVRAHGGRVEATESPLGGARFVVEIPDERSAEGSGHEPA
jgi:two-component system, NtrC family, sensor histidine kinase PilS